ncbi:MAG TPA: DUF5670 family protein [Candidatus Limnocylindria bacterium]
MLWIAIVALVMVWMAGLVTSVTLNGLLHLLLLVALGLLLWNLLRHPETI